MLKTSPWNRHYCYPFLVDQEPELLMTIELMWNGASSPTFDSSQSSCGITLGDQVPIAIFLLSPLLSGLHTLLWGARENEKTYPEFRSLVGDWISKTVLRPRALQREMETAEETIGTIWCPSSKLYFVFIQLKWQLVTLSGRNTLGREKQALLKLSVPLSVLLFPSLSPQGVILEGKTIPPLPAL